MSDAESCLSGYMTFIRNWANESRVYGFVGVDKRLLHQEIYRLKGIEYVLLGQLPSSAFEAARNELNFLFGRYQERT